MKIRDLVRNIFFDLIQYFRKKENRLAAGVFLAVFAGLGVYTVVRAVFPGHSTDFGNQFYYATRDILFRNESMFGKYSYNAYPPLFYCLIAPFAVFTKSVASLLWYLFSVAGIILTVGLSADMIRKELVTRRIGILIPLGLLFFVIADNLYLGQSNFIPLALMTLSFWFDQNKKELPSGVCLGLAIAVKVTPALFLLYFLIERKWMALLFAFLTFFLSVYVVPGFFFGFQQGAALTTEWFNRVIFPFVTGQKIQTDTVTYTHINQSLEGVLMRYLTPFGSQNYGGVFNVLNAGWNDFQAGILIKVLKGVFLACVVALHILFYDKKLVALSFYMYALILISPASWPNHYLLLLFPYLVLFNTVKLRWKGRARTAAWIAGGIGIAVSWLSFTDYLQALGFLFFGNLILFASLAVLLAARKIPELRARTAKRF